ncbi:MAG TPA: GvpL/GvpF family gas vesicle protein [Solirubrobacteraceae bacterium]|nr:GvpL/GvpF family gas vesicle protein [Solirubrobacteraceae bacterium]
MPAKYVYGIVTASTPVPDCAGIGGAALEIVADPELAALVSDVPAAEIAMGRDALTAHARVLEAALAQGTVLPMRFGVVMSDAEEIAAELLSGRRDELAQQLNDMAGKVELTLRATFEEAAVLAEIVREDQDVARLRESLRDADRDASYYGQIRLGELVSQALERKREAEAAEMLTVLEPLTLASRVSDPPHERVVLTASFLVERARLAEFDEAVDRIGEAQAARMRFTYTGPLPPYSFVSLAQGV